MKSRATTLGFVIALAACATPSSGPVVTTRGPPPPDEVASAIILRHLERSLKDPDSLKQLRIVAGPIDLSWYRGALNGGGHDEAWLYCIEYNAKNSYGAYTGLKVEAIAIRDIYAVYDVNWIVANRHC